VLSISIYIIVLITVRFFLKCMELLFIIFILGSLLILLMNRVDGLIGVSVYLGFDLMSLLLVLLRVWVRVLILLVARSTDFKDRGFLFFLVFIILCILSFRFIVYNLLGFYLFFEGVLIPILIIIYIGGRQPERISARMYMLIYTLFSSLPLLVILLKFNMFYSICFIYIGIISKLICSWVYIFIFIFAFLVKLPIYPIHL
jgi:NADH:ubiquinone oxidoreductase subunit 4 (subunit M)